METLTLKAEPRSDSGTRTSRLARAAGRLPAIIYGHGEAPESVTLDRHDVIVALLHGARILPVELGGKSKPYLIKSVQYDHLGSTPIHLDLARVDLHERVRVRVGIELRGTPKGVAEGGVLDQIMPDLEVECLVTEIPGTLHPLVTHLTLGASLYVKDLALPPGVIPKANPDDRVATVRAILEAVAAPVVVEGEEVVAEPERIGRVRKEDEEEA